jgi:hypothetical protein
MLIHDTLIRLTEERRLALAREGEWERLVRQARGRRQGRRRARMSSATLGYLLAGRRHALQ